MSQVGACGGALPSPGPRCGRLLRGNGTQGAPPLGTALAGVPQVREGEQDQQVSMGWAWSVLGLADSLRELREIPGDRALTCLLGTVPRSWGGWVRKPPWLGALGCLGMGEFCSWQMGLERQAGPRGTGSLRRLWRALVFSLEPTLDAAGGCVCGGSGWGRMSNGSREIRPRWCRSQVEKEVTRFRGRRAADGSTRFQGG